MHISGEEIRQEAEKREQTCPEGMKGSYYYGFREGAKWGIKKQKAINSECIAELEKAKASLVLEVHNKNKRIAELNAVVDLAVENRDYWKEQAIALKAKVKELIDKECEWLTEEGHKFQYEDMVSAFRKYMEEKI